MPSGGSRRLSRRSFLAATAGAGAAAVAGSVAGGALAAAAMRPTGGHGTAAAGASLDPRQVPFDGEHQAGIDRPAVSQAAAIFAAFDVVAADRDGLALLLRDLTARGRMLAEARTPDPLYPLYPPPESGILGSSIGPADLTVTVAVGASLFDGRYGLGDRRPRQLVAMPAFPSDVLVPDDSHGDLVLQICAADEAACLHALRFLMLGSRSVLALRWMREGFQRPNAMLGEGRTSTRNLLGFKDGTANPVPGTADFDGLVWVAPGDPEPAWTVGGSYLVARIIRMFVERWDRTALGEQEAIIGRSKRTGAPLGAGREEDIPAYAEDPGGSTIALDAHIRLANPRTPETERNRIFRRGFSFSRGFDDAGLLDQGLLFAAYQRDLEAGFVTVQTRLAGEPLGEYIRVVGGGYYFALPGVTGPDRFLGDALVG
jgi:deferrochelatase/peroxidase EfeB